MPGAMHHCTGVFMVSWFHIGLIAVEDQTQGLCFLPRAKAKDPGAGHHHAGLLPPAPDGGAGTCHWGSAAPCCTLLFAALACLCLVERSCAHGQQLGRRASQVKKSRCDGQSPTLMLTAGLPAILQVPFVGPISSDRVIKLPGLGMPVPPDQAEQQPASGVRHRCGDLFVSFRVVFPRSVTPMQKMQLQAALA